MKEKILWNRDFSLVVIGQIISLFGNAVLRFALPLYLLQQSGSAGLYGSVTALALIPMVLLSPIGGVVADRVNKRNIMVILDFSTAALMTLFCICMGGVSLTLLLIPTLMLLYGIQGAYQPAVQASIPALVPEKSLLAANAVINQVSALAGLLGPVAGGMLYGFWGVTPILYISILCFFASALMELFIRIPYEKRPAQGSIFAIAKGDMVESFVFIKKEKPVIWRVIGIAAAFNLFLSALIMVGLPVIITQELRLSSGMLGYSQGALAAGGLLGGILTGVLAKRLTLRRTPPRLLLGTALCMIPMGICLLGGSPSLAYGIITVFSFLMMILSTMFSVQMLSFVQQETPSHLVGKVISCILALCMCAQPVGSAIYGFIMEYSSGYMYWLFFFAAAVAGVIALLTKRVFTAAFRPA